MVIQWSFYRFTPAFVPDRYFGGQSIHSLLFPVQDDLPDRLPALQERVGGSYLAGRILFPHHRFQFALAGEADHLFHGPVKDLRLMIPYLQDVHAQHSF